MNEELDLASELGKNDTPEETTPHAEVSTANTEDEEHPDQFPHSTEDEIDPYEEEQLPKPEELLSPKDNAEIMVLTGEAMMTPLFRWLLKRRRNKLFKGKEVDIVKAKELQDSGDGMQMTPDQAAIYAKWVEMNERFDKIPLQEEESKKLIKTLTVYCKKHNIQIPVGFALAVSLGNVLLERVALVYED